MCHPQPASFEPSRRVTFAPVATTRPVMGLCLQSDSPPTLRHLASHFCHDKGDVSLRDASLTVRDGENGAVVGPITSTAIGWQPGSAPGRHKISKNSGGVGPDRDTYR